MKVWFKRVVVSVVALFLVALLGVAIFLLTFDPNAYKNTVQELVAERYQRTLQINGDLSLSLFPRIGLSVKDVSLSNRGTDTVFASIEQARVAVAIWPLLSNHLVVDHVRLNGFKAWVTRSEDGAFNFQDLLDGPEENGSEPAAALANTEAVKTGQAADALKPQSAQFNIDIAGFELKEGEVHFDDKQNGRAGRLTGVQVTTGRVTFDQPFDVTVRGQLVASKPDADARFQGQALLRLDRAQSGFSAQKLNVQVNGKLAALQAQAITLQGNVAYSAAHRIFDARGLSLEVRGRAEGETPVETLSATLSAPQLKVDPTASRLEVQRLSLRVAGKTAKESFDVAFDAPSLSVSPEQARGDNVSGTVKLSGSSVLGLALELSGLGGNARQLTLKEFKVDGTLKQSDQLTRVNLVSPLRWDAESSEIGLTAIKGDVKIDAETLGPSGFAFPLIGTVLVNLQKELVNSDLNAILNGNPLSFSTRLSGFKKPAIRLSLQADELDFDKLFPAPSKVSVESKGSGVSSAKPETTSSPNAAPVSRPAAVQTDTPINLKMLDDINLVANARVGRLSGRGLAAQDLTLDVKAEKGRLDVSQLAAKIYGGTLSGKASATSMNVFSTQLTMAGVAVGPITAAFGGHERLTGTAALRLNLTTRADTVKALLPGLGGTVQLNVRDGAVKGVNIQQTIADVADALAKVSRGQIADIGTKDDPSHETRFSVLDANLNIVKGVGTLTRLAVEAPLLRIAQGSPAVIDLVNQTLDVVANVRVVSPARGQIGPDLSRLRGLTVPVRVHGPFTAVSYGVEVKSLIGNSARQLLEQGAKDAIQKKLLPGGDAQGKSADQVKDLGNTLKGLIGR